MRVENLTVHSYAQNGIVFNGIDAASGEYGVQPDEAYGTEGHSLEGYEVRWVTAYNNGLYGIYAFASVNGLIENSYASGHPDSGLYVGIAGTASALVLQVLQLIEANLLAAYASNLFGIICVALVKIRHVRAAKRRLIVECQQEAEERQPAAA